MMPVGPPPAMQAPPQPTPVIVQQDLEIPLDKKCHFDGCPHLAQYICSYPTCANCENKNLGCGRKMCDEHRSTKSYSKKKHYPNPNICLNCEREAYKHSRRQCICSCVVFIIPFIVFVIYALSRLSYSSRLWSINEFSFALSLKWKSIRFEKTFILLK